MKLNFNSEDQIELERFLNVHEHNIHLLGLLSRFLNNYDCLISPTLFNEISGDSNLSSNYVYALAVNTLNDEEDREFFSKYLLKSIKEQNLADYYKEDYRNLLSGLTVSYGNWFVGKTSYLPYQGFVFNDLEVDIDNYYRINSNVGFFKDVFSYPSIKQNGREWMSLNPNEINTMKDSVNKAFGNVLVGGLGLGYYLFCISNKENVKSVTVVEKDHEVIEFFNKYLLDKFEYKNKIKIIESDVFDFLENNYLSNFDYAFMDIWHDTGDGLDLYLKLKKQIHIPCDFWIEKSILIQLRLTAIEVLLDIKDGLPFDISYSKVQGNFYLDLSHKEFDSFSDLFAYFNSDNLISIANNANN